MNSTKLIIAYFVRVPPNILAAVSKIPRITDKTTVIKLICTDNQKALSISGKICCMNARSSDMDNPDQ